MSSVSFRIEHLDKWCRDLKILYLQSNLIPKIGKAVSNDVTVLCNKFRFRLNNAKDFPSICFDHEQALEHAI